MEPEIIKKPFYKKWWFWFVIVVIVVGLFILVMAILANDAKKVSDEKGNFKTFSSEELKKAEAALVSGITLDDPKDDFISEADLVVPGYQVPQFDIKSVSFGVDEKYLYRKCVYWETAEEGLKIKEYSNFQMNCTNSIFINRDQDIVNKWGKGQYHMLTTNYDYAEKLLGIELFISIPEKAPEEEWDYPGNPYNIKRPFGGLVYGGAGRDYVIAAWPLSELGLKKGDAVTIFINTEVGVGGEKTHLAVDMVPHGSEKNDDMIKWIVGQNNYRIQEIDEKKDSEKKDDGIIDFETCAKVYPIMETYPEQCKTSDGRTFIKK